jgi:hypothetical protein
MQFIQSSKISFQSCPKRPSIEMLNKLRDFHFNPDLIQVQQVIQMHQRGLQSESQSISELFASTLIDGCFLKTYSLR